MQNWALQWDINIYCILPFLNHYGNCQNVSTTWSVYRYWSITIYASEWDLSSKQLHDLDQSEWSLVGYENNVKLTGRKHQNRWKTLIESNFMRVNGLKKRLHSLLLKVSKCCKYCIHSLILPALNFFILFYFFIICCSL